MGGVCSTHGGYVEYFNWEASNEEQCVYLTTLSVSQTIWRRMVG
jgi:hypothetical protein